MSKTWNIPTTSTMCLDLLRGGDGLLSFNELFGNDNPVEMEIGCGKAKLLIARACNYPNKNFVGIDYAWRFMKIGYQRTEKKQLQNIRFIKADARDILSKYTPSESVSIFHIYFPDPWRKHRHRKRRLINESFAELLHNRLEPNGQIEITTDDFDYYISIRAAFAETSSLWHEIRQSIDEPLFTAEVQTNYEMKFRTDGRTLYYLEVRK